jgi:tetratricopeptide (TPR) repeat protein
MGLGSWIKRTFGQDPESADRPVGTDSVGAGIRFSISVDFNRCVEVAGTTTFASPAVEALTERKALPMRGFYEGIGQLQREPDNPVDPNAVAVLIEGEKVGSLPSGIAKAVALRPGVSMPVQYQLHVLREDGFRAKAFVWLDEGTPMWEYSAASPPPLTARERTLAAAKGHSEMVKEALEGGGRRAKEFRQGMVQGVHYLQLIEPIKQLKRENRLEEALALCYQAIQGAEQDRKGREPAPWYTEQAAIIHRKLGQRDEEIAVLRRWISAAPPERSNGSKIAERLTKCLERKP